MQYATGAERARRVTRQGADSGQRRNLRTGLARMSDASNIPRETRRNTRRRSFQLRHAGAARCRTSLCQRTAQRRPLSPLLQPLQGAVVVVAVGRDYSAPPRSGETSRLAVSDAGRIRPPAVYRPFPLLNSQTPRLPAAKAIPVPMSSSAKSPVKRPFRGVCPSPRSFRTRDPPMHRRVSSAQASSAESCRLQAPLSHVQAD